MRVRSAVTVRRDLGGGHGSSLDRPDSAASEGADGECPKTWDTSLPDLQPSGRYRRTVVAWTNRAGCWWSPTTRPSCSTSPASPRRSRSPTTCTARSSTGSRSPHRAAGGSTPAAAWSLEAQERLERATGPLDTLVVSGGIGYVEAMDDRRLVAHVRRLAGESRRVAAVCTGSGILAAAGLLDGRRAATHWDHAELLSDRFPEVTFDGDPIFVTDGAYCTSAGVTSALDLTLSFIEADVGADLARQVARQLVTYPPAARQPGADEHVHRGSGRAGLARAGHHRPRRRPPRRRPLRRRPGRAGRGQRAAPHPAVPPRGRGHPRPVRAPGAHRGGRPPAHDDRPHDGGDRLALRLRHARDAAPGLPAAGTASARPTTGPPRPGAPRSWRRRPRSPRAPRQRGCGRPRLTSIPQGILRRLAARACALGA